MLKRVFFLICLVMLSAVSLPGLLFSSQEPQGWDVDEKRISEDEETFQGLSHRKKLFISGGFGLSMLQSDYQYKVYEMMLWNTYEKSQEKTGLFLDVNLGYSVSSKFQVMVGVKGPGYSESLDYLENTAHSGEDEYTKRDNYLVGYLGINYFFSNTYPSFYLSFGLGGLLSGTGFFLYEGMGVEILDFLALEFNLMHGTRETTYPIEDDVMSYNLMLKFFWYLY